MKKILLVDNFDSFTYNLLDYLGQVGLSCQVHRNNIALETLQKEEYAGVLLSPGPGKPREAGNLMAVLEYFHQRLPILGVCLGHQAIGEFCGATLAKAHKPMHGKISKIKRINDGILFKNLPHNFQVVRYHSLVLQNLPECLQVTALSEENEIMALEHTSLPICGVQFHPEAALTEFGLQILRNWVDSCVFLTKSQT
ncbi:MAG: aminodeoxychorismate/anthranilate synthase component II [Raineya sp.]